MYAKGEKVFYMRSTHYSGAKRVEYIPATITVAGSKTYEIEFSNGVRRRALPSNLTKEKK